MSLLSHAWHVHSHPVRGTGIRQQIFLKPWKKSTKVHCHLYQMILIFKFICPSLSGSNKELCRFQCLRGLTRGSAAARLLGLLLRISPVAWMSVCYECCVLSGRVLCASLQRSPTECVCVLLHVGNKQRAVCFSTDNLTGPKLT